MAKPYMALLNRHLYDNIFRKYGSGNKKWPARIYIPVGSKPVKPVEPSPAVKEAVESRGYVVDNYLAGTAIQRDGKRTMRIGKLLSKDKDVLRAFESDPKRKGHKVAQGELVVVISRHPYDVIGMSFDRGWTSCMNLKDGSDKKYLKEAVKAGVLVSYLVKATDANINNPIARILLVPYHREAGGTVLVPDGSYGDAPASFRKIVSTFCQWANSGSPGGHYVADKNVYLDGLDPTVFHGNSEHIDEALNQNTAEIRVRAIQSPNATEANLNKALDDEAEEVRASAAENPSATAANLNKALDDEAKEVRIEAAQNPNATRETLEKALGDKNKFVKSVAAKRLKGD